MKSRTPLCSDGTRAHHWNIGTNQVGHCIKPNCNAAKDFSPKPIPPVPKLTYDMLGVQPLVANTEEPQRVAYEFHTTSGYYAKLLEMLESCGEKSGSWCNGCPNSEPCWKWWDRVCSYTTSHIIRRPQYFEFRQEFMSLNNNGHSQIELKVRAKTVATV